MTKTNKKLPVRIIILIIISAIALSVLLFIHFIRRQQPRIHRQYDFVVLQDQARRPLNDTNAFLADVRILADAAIHRQAAYENEMILVNAGDAWMFAYNAMPDIFRSQYRSNPAALAQAAWNFVNGGQNE